MSTQDVSTSSYINFIIIYSNNGDVIQLLSIAGADIKEMQNLTYDHVYKINYLANWEFIHRTRTPVIGAISGYAVSCYYLCNEDIYSIVLLNP